MASKPCGTARGVEHVSPRQSRSAERLARGKWPHVPSGLRQPLPERIYPPKSDSPRIIPMGRREFFELHVLAELALCMPDLAQRCSIVRRSNAVSGTRFEKSALFQRFVEDFRGDAPACRRRCKHNANRVKLSAAGRAADHEGFAEPFPGRRKRRAHRVSTDVPPHLAVWSIHFRLPAPEIRTRNDGLTQDR